MQVGGLHALRQKLAGLYGTAQTNQLLSFTPDGARDASLAVLGVIAIQWFAQMNSDGTGYLAQRTMACRSDRDARGAALIFVGTQVLLRSLLWLPIGLGLLVLIPGLGDSAALDSAHYRALREASYVDGIARFLPAGVRGLLLTGMFAALASTLDTHLNWGASYFANDVYKRLYCEVWRQQVPSQRALVWIARASNGVILLVSLLILTRLQSVGSAWSLSLLLGAGMGVPLLLRWLWWRVTAASELAAIAGSALAAPLLLWQVSGDAARLLWMTLITSSLAVLAALCFPPEVSPGLREFYRRVQPPGFWRPVALATGQDPRLARQRLVQGLLSTLCAAMVVFGLLVVLGSLLVQAPKPVWIPSQGLWLGLVSAATALAAWGLRKLGHAEDDVALQPSQP